MKEMKGLRKSFNFEIKVKIKQSKKVIKFK